MTAPPIGGSVEAAFAGVRDLFAEVVASQPGTGASFAVWHDGRWVVDLWGGYADARRTRRWAADTLVMPYSVTKPFAAACVLLLVDRGVVDLDAPLRRWWPGLQANTTVREALTHRSGLVTLDEPAPEEAFWDWDLMCRLLAAQPPVWDPGSAQGESALFQGHLLGQVVRGADGRTLGRFLAEEVCRPHGLDFHVGLGAQHLGRVAELTGFGADFARSQEGATELYRRAVRNPPGARDPDLLNSRRWRQAEVPAVNGHGTARAVAGLYVALTRGGLLSEGLLEEATRGGPLEPDLVMGDVRRWGLGFAVDDDGFGLGGLGGSFGWWSTRGEYAAAFLTGHIGDHDRGDRLETAVREVLGLPPP